MTVNQRIFHYRKLSGFTQSEVAEQMGMKLPTYSKMEREGKVTIEKLEKIAKILDLDIELLISDERKEKQIEYIPVPVPNVTGGGTLEVKQPEVPIARVTEYIPTAREKATMKIVHNLPKNVQEEIYDFITIKMNENSKAKK